jgi:SH3-like domain-containing protein
MRQAMSLALLALLFAHAPLAAAVTVGPSGLPLPRFASLADDEVNARTGPGKDYPIRWVYTRRNLPVRIVEEFDVWRKVEDPDGDSGWIHAQLLSSRRSVVMVGTIRELRRTASDSARVVLRAEPGVIGTLVNCAGPWCLIEVQGQRGWVERDGIWGVLAEEWPN